MAFNEDLPELGQVPGNYFTGNSRITSGQLPALLNRIAQALGYTGGQVTGGFSRAWAYQTNTAVGYAGGFYEHAAAPDTFTAPVAFGIANTAVAAHLFVVTGADTSDDLTIQVTGNTIDDSGVRVPAAVTTISIPAGSAASTYFETSEKFNGQVLIEVVQGTPVSCNFGYSKYYDAGNRDFSVTKLETIWESDSSDSSSNIELIHHKKTGWTYNPVGEAEPPVYASRLADYGVDNTHKVGQGAWKRTGIGLDIKGSEDEGVLLRVVSGSTGLGALSFRELDIELNIEF